VRAVGTQTAEDEKQKERADWRRLAILGNLGFGTIGLGFGYSIWGGVWVWVGVLNCVWVWVWFGDYVWVGV
jgi:hypothetical protein